MKKLELKSFQFLEFEPAIRREARSVRHEPHWIAPILEARRPLEYGFDFPLDSSTDEDAGNRFPL